MKETPQKVHTYEGSDEQKSICLGKKYSIHMKRSFIVKVKSSKATPKIPENSTYVNLDIFPVKQKCNDINQGIQQTKVSKLAKTQPASTHLSLSSVKHKLDYNQFGNQSQQDQIIPKENNSDVTLGNPNTHKEVLFTSETDNNLVSNYTCVCCDANIVCMTNLSYLLKQITTITYLIFQKFYLMSNPKGNIQNTYANNAMLY